MATAKGAIQSNLLTYVTSEYPPSFISDDNTGSFYDQARDLYEKLNQLGVKAELNIYPKNEMKLTHGYESFNNEYGQDNMKKMIAFLEKLCVKGGVR